MTCLTKYAWSFNAKTGKKHMCQIWLVLHKYVRNYLTAQGLTKNSIQNKKYIIVIFIQSKTNSIRAFIVSSLLANRLTLSILWLHVIWFIRGFSNYPVLGTLNYFGVIQYSKPSNNPCSFWPWWLLSKW